ncbi:MAG: Sulfate transporter CysZ [Candidatus Erwinia impunctatus]|nr:Sulfate transporter CysZ [Culicoides impunctatus]
MTILQHNVLGNGIDYFFRGWKLACQPGIRRFVILPLLVNILLIGGAFLWLYLRLQVWIPQMMSYVPQWLQWLDYLIWPVAVASFFLVFGYFFSTIANFIAAPFCGMLSEKVEEKLTGEANGDMSMKEFMTDIPRMMGREWKKITWYLPRAIVLLLLYLIPVIGQTIAPLLWLYFSARMMAVQYLDYPFDNHKISVAQMHTTLKQQKSHQLQFGMLVNLSTLLPLINLVIMPVAVCGATAMWVDRFREQHNA